VAFLLGAKLVHRGVLEVLRTARFLYKSKMAHPSKRREDFNQRGFRFRCGTLPESNFTSFGRPLKVSPEKAQILQQVADGHEVAADECDFRFTRKPVSEDVKVSKKKPEKLIPPQV
jgi:hypothetical protein